MTPMQIVSTNSSHLMNLKIGMTKEQVLAIMGTKTFRLENGDPVNNPSKTESKKDEGGHIIEVLFYQTALHSGQNNYTPLVLKDNLLEGWGRMFYFDNVDHIKVVVE
jgi:hypothetical protein